MEKIPRAGGNQALLISSATYEALRAAALAGEVVPDPTQFETLTRAGKKFFRFRPAAVSEGGWGGGGAPPPFHPSLGGNGSGGHTVSFNPGGVLERNPKAGGTAKSTIHHMPEVADGAATVPMTTDPRPTLDIVAGQWAYCNFKTSDLGAIKGGVDKPQIIVDAAEKAGVHYAPPKADGTPGTEGDYWVPLCKLSIVDGNPVLTVFQQSDIEHEPYLWTPYDPAGGTGESSAPSYDPDKPGYVFPKLNAAYGLLATRTSDEMKVEVEAESVSGSGGTPVYIAPEGIPGGSEKLKFRPVKAYPGGGLNVSLDGESIQVKGSEVTSNNADVSLFDINIQQGIITTFNKSPLIGLEMHLKVYRCNVTYENNDEVPSYRELRVTRSTETPVEIWIHKGLAFGAEPAGFAGSTIELNAVYHTHVQGA